MKTFLRTLTLLCLCVLSLSALSEESVSPSEVLVKPFGRPDPNSPFITMLVSPLARPNGQEDIIPQTFRALQEVFGPNNFRAVLFSGNPEDIKDADLVLGSTGTYLRMPNKGLRDLATVASDLHPDPKKAEGSLFVTLKSRNDINTLEDMKGKRLAATGPNGFAGHDLALGELAQRGQDPDHFFSSEIYTHYDMPAVLTKLRNNQADIGIIRNCLLENLKKQGDNVDDIKPLLVKDVGESERCLTSTDLYPNWTIAATPRLSPELSRRVVLKLFSLPSNPGGLHWTVASDYSGADAMYKQIRRGPYAYLREWNLKRFWDMYWPWCLLGLVLLATGIAHNIRTGYLVEKRTRQLRESFQNQRRLEEKARRAQEKMASLQKTGVVGQMSLIVAHELRQPLSAISGYLHGIERLLDQNNPANSAMLSSGIGAIKSQAKTAESILEKVRSYARKKGQPRSLLNANEIVLEAVNTLNEAMLSPTKVTFSGLKGRDDKIWSDKTELELAVQNLLKNALHAVSSEKNPSVSVSVHKEKSSGGSPRIAISVSDNGPRLSDEAFEKLSSVLSSSKIDGLGLGLSIVRLIVENHGGQLEFFRGPENGLKAVIFLPEADENPGSSE